MSRHWSGSRAGCSTVLIMVGLLAGISARAEQAGLAAADAAPADNSNPYRAIVARNAFRLKDPAPPPPPPTNPPPVVETPTVDVKLAGLAEIGGVRYAYLMVPNADHPGQFEYPALTDDPKSGRGVRHRSGVEVKAIDIKAGTVQLVNGGIEATLNIKEHGVDKATALAARQNPAAAQARANTARRSGVTITPTTQASANTQPGAANVTPTTLSEPLVFSRRGNRGGNEQLTGSAAAQAAVATAAASVLQNNNNAFTAGNPGIPPRPVRTDANTAPDQAQAPVPLEQQYEILLRQKLAAESAGIPLPPIPGISPPAAPPPAQ